VSKPPTSITLRLVSEPTAAIRARDSPRHACAGLPGPLLEDAALLTSEVVTNSVKYAPGTLTIAIECTESAVEVSVADESSTMPTLREVGTDEVGGRGLQLVQLVAREWGCAPHRDGHGKTFWFRVSA